MSSVTIVIPAYNRAHYLPETISSALAQSVQDINIIVVDDGSTDNTAEVVRTFKDPRLNYIYQSNTGVSGALNTGCRAAETEFVATLGSDDVVLPEFVETLLPLMQADRSLGLVYARAQGMDPAGAPLPQILGAPLKFPGHPLASLLYGDSVCAIACLIRRSTFDRAGGYDESLIANEDWDLWIRMAELSAISYVDQILARFRMHPASLTGGRSAQYRRVILDRVKLIEQYYSQPNLSPEALSVKSLAFRNVYMDVAIRYLSIGAVREALPYLWRAIRAHGNPLVAAARITGVTLFDLYLSKTRWGTSFMENLVKWRRSLYRHTLSTGLG